ncbi:GlpM family protein [Mangrovibacter yixingensis]|uniref:GlpM family protein n=1 Tax=Mangrovibacter yixingensis TaxID=1529639 RepID=UPI001CFA87B1|nr:GlpM family protein [Mangrovibacter yixingensis]
MGLLFKSVIGAAVVVLIALLSRTRNYYIAGLVPLFPTFALLAHYIVASERGTAALRTTVIFGMWAIIPYFVYLLALWYLSSLMRVPLALGSAVLCWGVAAWLLIVCWSRWHS